MLKSVYRRIAKLEGVGGDPPPKLDPEASRLAELRKERTALLSSIAAADQRKIGGQDDTVVVCRRVQIL